MANYLARDGLHLDNVGAYKNSSTYPAVYGAIYCDGSLSGGTWINFTWDYDGDNAVLLLDQNCSSAYYRSFAIRVA